MAVTTLAHSQSHSDDADDDDDDDPGPARKPLFSRIHTGVAHHRPTGQGQAIRSMKGRGRPAVL